MLSTKCKFTGAKLDKCLITGQRKMLDTPGRTQRQRLQDHHRQVYGPDHDCNMLKARMAWLPMRAQYDENMFVMYGKAISRTHSTRSVLNARTRISRRSSRTTNDMQQYQSAFKGIDAGVQEQIYEAQASQMKQRSSTR